MMQVNIVIGGVAGEGIQGMILAIGFITDIQRIKSVVIDLAAV
jgi:hypothetical protein